MTKICLKNGTVWLLLIFLLAPVSVLAQRIELITESDNVLPTNTDSSGRSRQPDHKIHFILMPQLIDRSRISQMLVWEFQERMSKNAAHSYSRAYIYLTEKLDGQTSGEYSRLLTNIWDQAEREGVDTDFLTELTVKPLTGQQTPDDDLSEEELLAQHQSRFIRGIAEKQADYARFSLREHPEQLDAVKRFVEDFATVFRHIEEGSRCDYCDFGIPFRETDNPIGLLIPEISNMRGLSRAMSVKIMLEIHEKRYEDALHSIRVGLAMSRHTGKQPCMVSGLIGIAIQNLFLEQVQDMVNSSDCPNLYWELSSLPYPFLQFVDSAEIEKQALPQTFPLLRKAMTDPDAVLDDEWRLMFRQIDEVLGEMDNDWQLPKLPVNSFTIASYPAARKWLIGQGKSASEIDTMIPEKVVGLHTAHEIHMIYGEIFKDMYLPLWEQYDANEDFIRKYLQEFPGGNIVVHRLIGIFWPVIHGARSAYQRMQFSIDIMRIAEALRDFTARHEGQLPESLDAITQVPIPVIDPFTGRHYDYKLIDGKGRIETKMFPPTIVIFEMAK